MGPSPQARVAAAYRRFAAVEAHGSSPSYEAACLAAADTPELMGRLAGLPRRCHQPNLLLAVVRFLGGPVDRVDAFVDHVLDRWEAVLPELTTRFTQTNEAARTAAFLPVLAGLDGPVALIEIGCSAGLCLYPDRYAISYDGRPPVGDWPVPIEVATVGAVPVPDRRPEVVARIGLDRSPLDITRPDDLAWLEACIWPEHDARRARLRAAAGLVADDPPHLVAGDAVDDLDAALALVPEGATPVLLHSAVLVYLEPERRRHLARRIGHEPGLRWLANEAPGVVDGVASELGPPPGVRNPARFLLVEGGRRVLAATDPHGSWLHWA